MGIAEIALLVAVVAIPIALGVVTVYAGWPWWWGAILAIATFLVAAIAPTPEEGEARVAAEDLVFLLVVALLVAGLAWLGAWLARRFRRT